jgi:hypothetical protein
VVSVISSTLLFENPLKIGKNVLSFWPYKDKPQPDVASGLHFGWVGGKPLLARPS